MLTLTHTTHALLYAKSKALLFSKRVAQSTRLRVAQHSQFKISQYALEVLSSNPSAEDLGHLFETEQFSLELEEYLFQKMDRCPADKSYLDLVKEELTKLDLLVG